MTVNFELLKISKITSLKIYIISSHREARNIKFGQQVDLIQKISLGAPTQEVLMSLPHDHMTLTNFFISSHWGYCYQKFGQ